MQPLQPWSERQSDAFERLKAAWDKRVTAAADRAGFSGGVQWKLVKGREYLIHWHVDAASGVRRFDSMGPRSPTTEAWHRRFLEGRDGARRRLDQLDEELHARSADAKAKKIGHAPVAVGDVLRALASAAPEFRDHVVLTGSYALLAFETQARCTVPADLLALPETKPDLDLLVLDRADVDAIERLLIGLDSAYRREGPGGQKFVGPVAVDCFTTADVAAIGEQIYGGRRQDEFLDATRTPPIEAYLVDRSGLIAPVRALPIHAFLALKSIRAAFDPLRGDAERALDARQAEVGSQLAENIERTDIEISDDHKLFF